MKTLLFYASVTITFLAILSSCTKEKPDSPQVASTQSDEQLVSQVNWFMNAAKDVKEGKYLKSGEKMFLDSAVYFISASLNTTYGFPEQILTHTMLDETLINIPIIGTESKAYVVDALTAFNQTRSTIKNHILALNKTSMKTLGFVVENLGVNSTNTVATLKIITQIGYGSVYTPSGGSTTTGDWGFTVETQYWWTRNSSNCYDGSGNEGAPEVIENRLMFGYIPAPQPNCRYVYPFPYNVAFDPLAYEVDQTKDNFCDYKIFYARGTQAQIMTDLVQCLGLDPAHPGIHEMNFYCTGLKEIIDDFFAQPGYTNYKCQKIFIDSPAPQQYLNNPNILYIEHLPILFYGIRQLVCNIPAIDITTYVE